MYNTFYGDKSLYNYHYCCQSFRHILTKLDQTAVRLGIAYQLTHSLMS